MRRLPAGFSVFLRGVGCVGTAFLLLFMALAFCLKAVLKCHRHAYGTVSQARRPMIAKSHPYIAAKPYFKECNTQNTSNLQEISKKLLPRLFSLSLQPILAPNTSLPRQAGWGACNGHGSRPPSSPSVQLIALGSDARPANSLRSCGA